MKYRSLSNALTFFLLLMGVFIARDATAVTVDEALKIGLKEANKSGETKLINRYSNLINGYAALSRKDLVGVVCGSKPNDKTSLLSDEEVEQIGDFLSMALEKLIPAIAVALESATGTGVALFLQPSKIAPDAVEIINQANTRDRAEVTQAARQLLQDTKVENFKKMPRSQMARIVVCGY